MDRPPAGFLEAAGLQNRLRPSVRPGWRAGPAQILIRPSLRPDQRTGLAIGLKVEPYSSLFFAG